MSDFQTRRITMVDTQVRPQDVTKFPIIAAMLAVPREDFVPQSAREAAYVGGNIPLAPRRVELEARSLAKLLDALDVVPAEKVLCLGAGYGYAAAVLAEMGADVVAVEEDAAMAAAALVELAGVNEDWRRLHDRTADVMAGLLAYVAKLFGEAALEPCYRSVMEPYLQERYMPFDVRHTPYEETLDRNLYISLEAMRGHVLGQAGFSGTYSLNPRLA